MRALGLAFFFVMLVIPTTFQLARGAVLAVLLGVAGILAMRRGFRLDSHMGQLTLLCVTTSTVFMIWGAVNDAPGALRVGTVFVAWPLIYVFFIGTLHKVSDWEPYLKMLVWGTLASEAMYLLILSEALGITSFGILAHLDFIDFPVGLYEGFVELYLVNLPTMLFVIPYLLSKSMQERVWNSPGLDTRFWELVVLFIGLVLLIFSGKRIFWVVVLMAPIMSISIAWSHGAKSRLAPVAQLLAIGILALAVSFTVYDLDPGAMWNDFVQGFEFGGADEDNGAYRRREQFIALMSGWEASPLIGAGHGAAAGDKIGQPEEAWAYELWYLALLFQVGIIGFLIYAGAVCWLYYRSILLMREDPSSRAVLVPLLTGMSAFLIANATNPYLSKFDYLWVVFLPAAILNAYLIRNRDARSVRTPRGKSIRIGALAPGTR